MQICEYGELGKNEYVKTKHRNEIFSRRIQFSKLSGEHVVEVRQHWYFTS